VLLAVVLIAAPLPTYADDGCCDHCGCGGACQKVCRLVCEEKKVDVVCWGCICEDFCVPKRSKRGCRHCETVCAECGECSDACSCEKKVHSKPKRFVWTEWCPGCAKIFTRKKLMKKIEKVTIPSYKWVVEDLCPSCEASCGLTAVGPDVQLPTPPLADARLLYMVK
jgi:hypothetical protein